MKAVEIRSVWSPQQGTEAHPRDIEHIRAQQGSRVWKEPEAHFTHVKRPELRDPISGYEAPLDPQDGTPYEYRVLGDLRFELCASFKTDSTAAQTTSMYGRPVAVPIPAGPYAETFDNWVHGVGRACFNRTIDPERYSTEPGPEPAKAR